MNQTRLPNAPPEEEPKPRVTSSEPAVMGGEGEPTYANLIREISPLPPPAQGGDG